MKQECGNTDEIFAIGYTDIDYFDNFLCSQWRKHRKNDGISVSVSDD